MSGEYFFKHLKDDIFEEDHGEGDGVNTFNKCNKENDNHFVHPVCNVLEERSEKDPE